MSEQISSSAQAQAMSGSNPIKMKRDSYIWGNPSFLCAGYNRGEGKQGRLLAAPVIQRNWLEGEKCITVSFGFINTDEV